MISIPLYIFLGLFFLYLAVFVVFFVANFVHLFHTGGTSQMSFVITVIMIGLSALVLLGASYYLRGVDWGQTIDLGNTNIDIFYPQP